MCGWSREWMRSEREKEKEAEVRERERERERERKWEKQRLTRDMREKKLIK